MTKIYLPKRLHPDFRDPNKRPMGPVAIDWNNPLSRGLLFYPVWEGNNARCLVTGELGTVAGTGITQVLTDEGVALSSAGASSVTFTKPKHINGGPFTIATRWAWDGVDNINQGAICLPSSDDGTMYLPDIDSMAWDTAGGGQTNMDDQPPQSDVDAGVFATWSIANHTHSSGNPGLFAYKNGSRLEHGASNHTYAPTAGDSIKLFEGQSSQFAAGDMLFVALWDRQLSSAEQIMLANDPYQILRPLNDSSYLISEGNTRSQVIAPFIPPIVDFIFRMPNTVNDVDAEITIYSMRVKR